MKSTDPNHPRPVPAAPRGWHWSRAACYSGHREGHEPVHDIGRMTDRIVGAIACDRAEFAVADQEPRLIGQDQRSVRPAIEAHQLADVFDTDDRGSGPGVVIDCAGPVGMA